jgi:hypothetical protein
VIGPDAPPTVEHGLAQRPRLTDGVDRRVRQGEERALTKSNSRMRVTLVWATAEPTAALRRLSVLETTVSVTR